MAGLQGSGAGGALNGVLLVVGTIRLPVEKLAQARPVMAKMIAASRAEDGCSDYAYAQDLFDPGLIHVRESWRDQAALDRHFTSPHIAEWRASWPDLGITDRALQVYEVGQPCAT